MAKIKANHIPYRGAAPALTDLMAGRIQYTFDGVATSLGYARAGNIRILGVAGPKRSPVIPDTPTIAEKALPGFETVVWFGLFAPAKTPHAVVELINRKINEVLAMPSIKESFAKLGIEGVGGTPDALAARVRAEMEKWAKLVRETESALRAMRRRRAAANERAARNQEETQAMTAPRRQMHLGVFVLGTGDHSAGWRYEGAYTSGCSLPVMKSIASIAERGKFDLFFLSDGLAMDVNDHPSFLNRFEPLTLLSALSMVTKHIGLGATVSTSFSEPYNVARAFASLDHISGGRAGWNVVTSTNSAAALNFSRDRLNEHDLRYEIAGEFVDVVRGLWDGWDDGAIVADRATGTFLDASKVRPLNHKGRFFQVKGPLNIERSPAGPSDHHPGRRLAARPGTVGALGRSRVLGGQRRSGVRQGGLRQPQAAGDQARPPSRACRDPARRDADHRRDRRAGQGAARPAAELPDADQCAHPGIAAGRL